MGTKSVSLLLEIRVLKFYLFENHLPLGIEPHKCCFLLLIDQIEAVTKHKGTVLEPTCRRLRM